MQHWRLYDGIAENYDRTWSARFEIVARHLWARIPLKGGDAVLDIGTGTGIVLRVHAEFHRFTNLAVGCDRSVAMLQQARAKAPQVRFVAADATALPFRHNTFHVVIASFVLSHIQDWTGAVAEMFRVTRSGGSVAVSNWAPASDPYTAAWNEFLAGAISKAEVDRASAEVIPSEAHFSQPGALQAGLAKAGFAETTSFEIPVKSEYTVEQFIEDRSLSSAARLGRQQLGPDGWIRFRTNVSAAFHTRFGPSFQYRRGALIAIAKKY